VSGSAMQASGVLTTIFRENASFESIRLPSLRSGWKENFLTSSFLSSIKFAPGFGKCGAKPPLPRNCDCRELQQHATGNPGRRLKFVEGISQETGRVPTSGRAWLRG
jgi:hypothetical protein